MRPQSVHRVVEAMSGGGAALINEVELRADRSAVKSSSAKSTPPIIVLINYKTPRPRWNCATSDHATRDCAYCTRRHTAPPSVQRGPEYRRPEGQKVPSGTNVK